MLVHSSSGFKHSLKEVLPEPAVMTKTSDTKPACEFITSTMLLSPQQRLSPYKAGIWTRVWKHLNEVGQREHGKCGYRRFNVEQVSENLMCSLACYQPLSRCTMPQTPGGISGSGSLNDFSAAGRHNFNEVADLLVKPSETESQKNF
uniref:Uncharacterized protein n=1 Tax=Glossina pallidipes TaxID=7398 RepID=A0A1A9ZQL3_GLOPL